MSRGLSPAFSSGGMGTPEPPTSGVKTAAIGKVTRFPFAAVAAVTLVVLFEIGFVYTQRYHFWYENYILLEKVRTVLTGNPRPDDVAILGSSRFNHVRPDAIAKLSGKSIQVTNYCWGFCGVETYEAMLRGLIQAGRTPKMILTDGTPEIFGFRPEVLTITKSRDYLVGFAQTAPFNAAMRTVIGLKKWALSWDIFEHVITPPSTLYREPVKKGLQSLLTTGKLQPEAPQEGVKHWLQYGFIQPPKNRVAVPEQFLALEITSGPWFTRDNKQVARSYERFIRLARDHNIQVILVPVPNNPLVYEKFMATGVYEKYNTWLNRLERKYNNFEAPGPRWMVWPGLLFDAIHVNAAGGRKHMELVLEILRNRMEEDQLPFSQSEPASVNSKSPKVPVE